MKLLFSVTMFWLTTLVHAQNCPIVGQVFFTDAFDHTVSIKTDSGDLVNFGYDSATKFLVAGSGLPKEVPANRILPEELNVGDRLCVGTSEPLAVTVTPRRKIEARQRNEIADWQADSLYGIVSGVDQKARRITLTVSAGNKTTGYSVDVSPLGTLPPDPSEQMRWVFDNVTLGDPFSISQKNSLTGMSDRGPSLSKEEP